jgi:hypothetical protein
MNTRKYPRTMNEAFHNTADYACSIERQAEADSIVTAASIVAIFAMLIIIAIWG